MVSLSACSGFNTFFQDTHWFGVPNKVLGNSENLLRVRGSGVEQPALRPEPGDVWPGPIPPQPTLQQLMREESQQFKQPLPAPMPIPGEPGLLPGGRVSPRGAVPGAGEPALPPLPGAPATPGGPPASRPGAPGTPPKAPPGGHVYQTPEGPAVGTPGPGGYETLTSPKGEPGGIVVPNGNGTSTIIMPDGKVLTVPTPK
jgi:hypothetical protein